MEEQANLIYANCKFQKSPRTPTKQIRLLSLKSSADANGPLAADLTVKDLHDANTRFTALSYVWGDESIREPLVLNGINTSITKNLAEVLRSLRTKTPSIDAIWADAVSINQHDGEEKSAQVAIMGEIYSKAECTYLWLGEEKDHSDIAMDLVTNITEERVADFDSDADEWRGVYHLLRRDWWSRLWIIQEAFLSARPIVKCGTKETDLYQFADLHTYWNLHQYKHENWERFNSLNLFEKLPFSAFLSRATKRSVGVGLNQWMLSVDSKCKYRRDHIYGLLGLSGPVAKAMVEISYSKHPTTQEFVKSDREILLEAGCVVFAELRSLAPLMMAYEKNAPWLNLPSWCPDWTCTSSMTAIDYSMTGAFPLSHFNPTNSLPGPWFLPQNRNHPKAFRCARWRERTTLPLLHHRIKRKKHAINYAAFHFGDNAEVLAVRGYIVDVVDFVSVTPWVEVGDTAEGLKQSKIERANKTLEAVRLWEQHVERNKVASYSKAHGGSKEAFWRTLIADRDFDMADKGGYLDSSVPTSDFQQYFEAWMGRGPHAGDENAVKLYSRPAIFRCAKRAFITTTKGYFGLAPALPTREGTQVRDMVCILRGATAPCILRHIAGTNFCSFEGLAYVHGIMDGEYLRQVKVEDLQEFWIK